MAPWSTALSPEHQQIFDEADRFARSELRPLAARMDDEEWWPDAVFRSLGKLGYFGISVPAELGGTGADIFTTGLVAQAFARSNHAFALAWVVPENLCLGNVYANASDEKRARFHPQLLSGEWIGALGLTEAGDGSDARGPMLPPGRPDGDERA